MLINCKNISFKYEKSESYVLRGISFKIEGSGFYALFGPSGVGKSTLARVIAREIKESSGTVIFENLNKIIYTYNQERIPGWYSIKDHFITSVDNSKQEELFKMSDEFGISDCLNKRFEELSLGQKNRANLIRYLFQDFDILIMDESLANVDEKTREEILFIIKESFPDRSFLYISHNLQEVVKFCKEIFVIRDSKKVPQVKMVFGIDLTKGLNAERKKLDQALLEILNVS